MKRNALMALALWGLTFLATLTGCQEKVDLNPLSRTATTGAQLADAAAGNSYLGLRRIDAVHEQLAGDGGLRESHNSLSDRIGRIERCNRDLPDWGAHDCDEDGIDNQFDACPSQAQGDDPNMRVAQFARRGCLDDDDDGDRIGNSQDQCPEEAEGSHPDSARLGCPDRDDDGDGFYNSADRCHAIPIGDAASTEHDGCPDGTDPDPDEDEDGLPDYRDVCPTQKTGDDPHPVQLGCPDLDTDGDGHPDRWDGCPNLRVQRSDHLEADSDAGIPPSYYEFPGCPNGIRPTTRGNDRPLPEPDASIADVIDAAADETPEDDSDAAPPPADAANDNNAAVDAAAQPTPDAAPAARADASADAPRAEQTPATLLNGSDLGVPLTQATNRRVTARLCTGATQTDLRAAPDAPCGPNELYCYRPTVAEIVALNCGAPGAAAGACLLPGPGEHLQNICASGAEVIVRVRCGRGVSPCTVANLVASIRARQAPRSSVK